MTPAQALGALRVAREGPVARGDRVLPQCGQLLRGRWEAREGLFARVCFPRSRRNAVRKKVSACLALCDGCFIRVMGTVWRFFQRFTDSECSLLHWNVAVGCSISLCKTHLSGLVDNLKVPETLLRLRCSTEKS